jgi:predicted metal-dependent hydrolase
VWEDLWQECGSPDRRFYQALIQAAVAAYHWGRGNAAGAGRLYHSGRKYMEPFRPRYLGLAVDDFWDAMAAHLAGALGDTGAPAVPPPTIVLV